MRRTAEAGAFAGEHILCGFDQAAGDCFGVNRETPFVDGSFDFRDAFDVERLGIVCGAELCRQIAQLNAVVAVACGACCVRRSGIGRTGAFCVFRCPFARARPACFTVAGTSTGFDAVVNVHDAASYLSMDLYV